MALLHMTKSVTYKKTILVTSFSTLLAACGGGGGSDGGGSTSGNTTTAAPVVIPTAPISTELLATVTNTPVTSSPSAGITQNVLTTLNANRHQCGFGALTYNDELEKAAANHANYLGYVSTQNKTSYGSHIENSVTGLTATGTENPYYTGYSVSERIKTNTTKGEKAQSVSYDASMAAENLSLLTLTTTNTAIDTNAVSQAMLTGLLAAPYHMRSLVSPNLSQIGINYNQVTWQNTTSNDILSILEMVSASPNGQVPVTTTDLLSYPCQGSTGTAYELINESPNPIPSRDLEQNPVGQPIYLLAPSNKTITNVTATLAVQGVSASNLTILTQANDPNKLIKANEAFIIPEIKLRPATTYTVSYTVTYSTGEQITKSFDFSTKA